MTLKVQMPRMMSGPCGTNGQVGKSWRCRCSTAQCYACGVCWTTTLSSFCHMFVFDLCWDTLAWSNAERTGCNVVKQSFQYHGSFLLRREKVGKRMQSRWRSLERQELSKTTTTQKGLTTALDAKVVCERDTVEMCLLTTSLETIIDRLESLVGTAARESSREEISKSPKNPQRSSGRRSA